jgi:type VI secretion system secreted protein VgrG
MASPKSVKEPSIVAPAEPVAPEEPVVADPGEAAKIQMAKAERQAASLTEQKVKPFKPREQPESGEEVKTTWIEIELVDMDDKPIPGEPYRITMPDGSVHTGTLDDKGFARVEGLEPGSVKVTFPKLDKDAWEPA